MSKCKDQKQEEIHNTEMDTDMENSPEEQVSELDENALLERIQILEKQLEEASQKEQELLLRTRAEIENIRRRTTQDIEKAHKFALEKFSKDLLETIDNLERALLISNEEMTETAKSLIEGVDLTLKGLLKTVEIYGVKTIGQVGEEFDPNLHHAIKQEKTDGMDANKITTVLQKGYTLNGRVIRPAMVMISA